MKSSKEITIILILAMGLTILPGPVAAAYSVGPDSDVTSSGPVTSDPCEAGSCSGESTPMSEDCCEAGCLYCSLPCCAGTVMIPALAQVLDSILAVSGQPVTLDTAVAWVEADPLYHPPRG